MACSVYPKENDKEQSYFNLVLFRRFRTKLEFKLAMILYLNEAKFFVNFERVDYFKSNLKFPSAADLKESEELTVRL